MKLDKIKFASFCMLIQGWFDDKKQLLSTFDIEELDRLIDINVEPVATQYVEAEKVDELLRQLNASNGFINAIKAYRSLTGAGLKESKEAIERYRNVPRQQSPFNPNDELYKLLP